MKLAYLVMQFPAPSETFMAIEVRHLAKAGADMTVFCLREPNPQDAHLRQQYHLQDIPIYHFAYWTGWQDIFYWSKKNPFIFWFLVWQVTRTCWQRPTLWLKSVVFIPKSFHIVRLIEQGQIQVVHAGWGHYPTITLYLLKLLLPQIPITLALTAYDRLEKHPMTILAAKRAAYLVAQSPESAREIQELWPKTDTPLQIIHIGIELERLEKYRALPKKQGVIISAGRLVQEKGHHYVIQAFSKIHAVLPATRLILLGEGHYRHELELLIKNLNLADCVELTGHLPQEKLFEILAQASVSVLASEADYDTLPNTIKESMALGVPVVTTPTMDIEVLIEDGITGCLVPKGDVSALEIAIFKVFNQPAWAQEMSEKAYTRVHALFDIEHTTHARLQMFKDILN